jgi:hypothetical protein
MIKKTGRIILVDPAVFIIIIISANRFAAISKRSESSSSAAEAVSSGRVESAAV